MNYPCSRIKYGRSLPIRKTAETFSKKAFKALVNMTKNPILGIARKGAQPSVKGMKHALMMAQI